VTGWPSYTPRYRVLLFIASWIQWRYFNPPPHGTFKLSINKSASPSNKLATRQKTNLAIENKLLIYKTIIIPIWTYGLELWDCDSKSSISIIQRSQSKILRMIVDVPWYVSNAALHADLGISYVHEVIYQKCNKHHTRLGTHENPLLKTLLVREENRRLKINLPIGLI
jgi:hypothetical protein